MSTLTKTFVILNLIFSVAFVMVSATVLSQRHHWKNKHAALEVTSKREVDGLKDQNKKLLIKNGNLDTDLETSKGLAERRDDQLTDRDTAIRAKNAAIAAFKEKEAERNATVDHLSQNVNRLASDLKATQKELNETKDELQEVKTELGVRNTTLVGLRAQLAGLELKHQELLHRYDIAMDRIGNYEQDMAKLKSRYPAVYAALRGSTDDLAGVDVIGPPIRSTVRAVDAKLGVVVLGVGSKGDNPVKKGHQFLIYRGRTFVAKVSVVNVDAEMCAARVVDPLTKIVIQVGDKAVTQ